METQTAQANIERWYHWHRFAVLPRLRRRKADKYNTASFNFHWLVFRVWSMDSFEFNVQVELDDQGFTLRAMVPYLIFGAFVPLFPSRWSQRLWRRPPALRVSR